MHKDGQYTFIYQTKNISRIYSSQKKIGNWTKISYIGVKIWESIDQNLKVQPFYVFKKKCKLHFLNQ